MKRILIYLVCISVFFALLFIFLKHNPVRPVPFVPKAERAKMSRSELKNWLEHYGSVPEDANYYDIDWVLAQRTSWWGKPLDAKRFWQGKVVWRDEIADKEAHRHGRGSPPIPNNNEVQSLKPDDAKINWGSMELESLNIHYAISEKEHQYWDRFGRKMPNPPAEIARQQDSDADSMMVERYFFEKAGNPGRINAKDLSDRITQVKEKAMSLGFPEEAFTEEALYWEYVMKCRQEYAKSSTLPRETILDPKLITDPLTLEQAKAANAWKLGYLRRLRQQQADEQYVQAYLKAWNLSEEEVFGKK